MGSRRSGIWAIPECGAEGLPFDELGSGVGEASHHRRANGREAFASVPCCGIVHAQRIRAMVAETCVSATFVFAA